MKSKKVKAKVLASAIFVVLLVAIGGAIAASASVQAIDGDADAIERVMPPIGEKISWHIYNGHSYTLTNNWSTWAEAEQEAVSLGGHLVTINDDAENAWLTETFKDTYVRSYSGDPWQNIVWIGYYYDASSESWKWISQEPVTYYRHDYPLWPQGGTRAYLHLAYHPYPGTWNANPLHDTDYSYQPKGIIEVGMGISIYTDKTSYTTNDTMHVGLDVTNPGGAQAVSVGIGLDKPDGSTVWFINKPSVTLPAGFEYSKDKLIILPSIPAGIYTWRAILDDPVTGEIICEDTAEWEFVGGEGLTDLTEILKEITIIEDFGE